MREHVTRDRILAKLAGTAGWASGEEISAEIGISRAAVGKHIAGLRADGNIIDALPHRGYRLISTADPWAGGQEALPGLRTRAMGQGKWTWFRETGSTNQAAAAGALAGDGHGAVVAARRQSAGRGSNGRAWTELPGSLLFSVIARPEKRVAPPDMVSAVQQACASAIRECCGAPVQCKAPNDLMLNGRKVGGILVESMFHNDLLRWAVLGIGINVNAPASAFPGDLAQTATSLYAETGEPQGITALMRRILELLDDVPVLNP